MNRRTCGDLLVCYFISAREAAGALTRPAFPAPSILRGWFAQRLGRDPCRGRVKVCLEMVTRITSFRHSGARVSASYDAQSHIGESIFPVFLWPDGFRACAFGASRNDAGV